MVFTTPIVPMPRWSTPVGCTKLVLSIVVLTFVAVCAAVYGSHPAFNMTMLSASLSLSAFGYYLTALSFRPELYNKRVVLVLESSLTTFWLVSLVLLAAWTSDSINGQRWMWTTPYVLVDPTMNGNTVNLDRQSFIHESLALCSPPLGIFKRQAVAVAQTSTRLHGQEAHQAARVLAGISAGTAGVMFALYTATLFAFTINFNKPPITSNTTSDEENQPSSNPETTRNDSPTIQPGTAKPPSVTQPLRVNTLPKDFEPKPQAQEHYLTPQQAAEAGIEPPTPILKVQAIEKENGKEKSVEAKDKEKVASQAESTVDDAAISPIEENEKKL